MIKSMTGYGKGEGGGYVVEMRSVNHKFLDASLKVPRCMTALEGRIRKAVSDRFSRGRIDVYITQDGGESGARSIRLDTITASRYVGVLTELKEKFGLAGNIDLGMVAGFEDIIVEEEAPLDMEGVWTALAGPLDACMAALDDMRAREGGSLAKDITKRAGMLAANIDEIEKRSPVVVEEYRAKLAARIAKLSEGVELDPARLTQEVALMADRSDVTEEIVRARSHFAQLAEMIASEVPAGRKMDFLIQEINREVNTIGSKASDKDIAYRVVDMKAELEKVREQVQNIE
ncbi:MAG TPA: YicC/YloC family endoribonuclease [Nitrospirota bacterium]